MQQKGQHAGSRLGCWCQFLRQTLLSPRYSREMQLQWSRSFPLRPIFQTNVKKIKDCIGILFQVHKIQSQDYGQREHRTILSNSEDKKQVAPLVLEQKEGCVVSHSWCGWVQGAFCVSERASTVPSLKPFLRENCGFRRFYRYMCIFCSGNILCENWIHKTYLRGAAMEEGRGSLTEQDWKPQWEVRFHVCVQARFLNLGIQHIFGAVGSMRHFSGHQATR